VPEFPNEARFAMRLLHACFCENGALVTSASVAEVYQVGPFGAKVALNL
jgi:hypothetical protein